VDAYETPLGRVPLDGEAVAQLRGSPLVRAEQEAHRSEHAIEIELPFLQRALQPGWGLVPILVGRLDPPDYPAVAALLRPLVDTGTLVVVSSDLTHFGARFGYQPFAPDGQAPERIRALDEGALERIVAKDTAGLLDYQARTGITICGYRPLALLLELLPADARVARVAYASSGDITGDWRHSVSYAALAVTLPAPAEATDGPGGTATQGLVEGPELERLHRIAVLGVKAAAEGLPAELEAEIAAASNGLPPGLRDPAGAFVTLWSNGQLRGCVGHVLDDLPLYRAVLESGYRAARLDHRFRPVGPEELAGLEVEVSVLSPLRRVDSIDSIHLGEHGITLRKGGHYGLYLPEVAGHMGWDLDTTLSQLALKAGLPEDAWQEGASFEVFTTTHVRAPYPAEALRQSAIRGSAGSDR
jgi:AmmeMemoRadiSam system protein A/AmmeMemoRadiSam system protein B